MSELVEKPVNPTNTWRRGEQPNVSPLDFGQLQALFARADASQQEGEDFLRTAARQLGETAAAYRKALALEITRLRNDSAPATLARDLARGNERIADLKAAETLAEGIYEAAKQACYRHAADRREVEQLGEWSRRVALDGQQREPRGQQQRPIGARPAA